VRGLGKLSENLIPQFNLCVTVLGIGMFGLVAISFGHLISFWWPQLAKSQITNLVAKMAFG